MCLPPALGVSETSPTTNQGMWFSNRNTGILCRNLRGADFRLAKTDAEGEGHAIEDEDFEEERRPLNLSIILNVIKASACYRKALHLGKYQSESWFCHLVVL